MNLDMAAQCEKITIAEVLTLHGSADATVPPEDAASYAKAVRNHMLCMVEGADHNFRSREHVDKAVKKVVDYICGGL